jgi:hypothetical protein
LGFTRAYRHDANPAIRSGSDTNRPSLDLFADEFLDIRQVGVGFEVTPVSAIARASHRCVVSMPEREDRPLKPMSLSVEWAFETLSGRTESFFGNMIARSG